MKTNIDLDQVEMSARVRTLSAMGATIGKAAKYLNAESPACFYASKLVLWVMYMGGDGKMQYRPLGTFA